MIHIGKNTKSTIVSKGISAGRGQNTYRGMVKMQKSAEGARNYSQCDSLLIGDKCGAHTFPYLEVKNTVGASGARSNHFEASGKIRSSTAGSAASPAKTRSTMIVNGFCKEVFQELPMEFAVEAQKLLSA
jgi:Fe-S cluster assembly protein SufB